MSKKRNPESVASIIDDINRRLDNIGDMAAWLVRADQRFKKGQRVQFSKKADRAGISQRRKNGVRRGKVCGTNGFSVLVQLDGYKKPSSYHHSFFERVTRSR